MVNDLLVERGFGPLEGTPLRAESEIEDIAEVETRDQRVLADGLTVMPRLH
jgi:hypothetical protein